MIYCPECNSPEVHPDKEDKILIRGCQVSDEDNNTWSHCMVCSGNYDKDYNWLDLPLNGNEGWFIT